MPLIIARAEVTDAPAIARIQVECWRKIMSRWAPADFIALFNVAEQAEKYAARIQADDATLFVARQDGSVVGVIGAKPNELGQDGFAQYIFGLYVDPAVQRQGIGFLLLTTLLDVLKQNKAGDAIIFTFTENHPARKLYEKCGGTLLSYTDNVSIDLQIPHVSYGFEF